jgi:hypothetical protein
MKRTPAAICIAALALGTAIPAYATGPHLHESAHPASPAQGSLAFDQGRKWSTDAALRRHMEDIRASLAQRREAILADKLTPQDERALAETIEQRVAAILTDCKLEPRADANLHLIVADLVRSADILQGKSSLPRRHGASLAVRATQMYATYFDHPGWIRVY